MLTVVIQVDFQNQHTRHSDEANATEPYEDTDTLTGMYLLPAEEMLYLATHLRSLSLLET